MKLSTLFIITYSCLIVPCQGIIDLQGYTVLTKVYIYTIVYRCVSLLYNHSVVDVCLAVFCQHLLHCHVGNLNIPHEAVYIIHNHIFIKCNCPVPGNNWSSRIYSVTQCIYIYIYIDIDILLFTAVFGCFTIILLWVYAICLDVFCQHFLHCDVGSNLINGFLSACGGIVTNMDKNGCYLATTHNKAKALYTF